MRSKLKVRDVSPSVGSRGGESPRDGRGSDGEVSESNHDDGTRLHRVVMRFQVCLPLKRKVEDMRRPASNFIFSAPN